jgi:hypothetical protein
MHKNDSGLDGLLCKAPGGGEGGEVYRPALVMAMEAWFDPLACRRASQEAE